MNIKKHIIDLRKKIPIGITAAKKLLEQTDFDLLVAEKIWQTNQVEILSEKIEVKPEEAKELLEYVKYDFAKALSLYRDRNTTDVEKILQSSKDAYQILGNFWSYISQYLGDDVKYGGWIYAEGFEQLPNLIKQVLTVWQWYAYYDYEGISVEQRITDDVVKFIDQELGLTDFANDLKSLKQLVDSFYKENPYDKNDLKKSIESGNKLKSSKEYQRIDDEIIRNEDLVMKKTYEYLYKNSSQIEKLVKNTLRDKRQLD